MIAGLLLAGCPESNTLHDDGGAADSRSPDLDASIDAPEPDDPDATLPRPDVFVCPDGDGDGETDARCGGTDCDDEDAMLSSTQGPCGTPTAIHRCVAGAAADIECTGETPYCDARIGACVANACGDGVMHANEFCEIDRGYCSECRAFCRSYEECAANETCAPATTFDGRRLFSVCVVPNPAGLADGEWCELHEECASTYCDPWMGRCTSSGGREGCDRPDSYWEMELEYARSLEPGTPGTPFVCKHSCFHQSECRLGSTCVLAWTPFRAFGDRFIMATCMNVPTGSTEFGGACGVDTDCESGVCVGSSCTRVCRDDADCGGMLPSCLAVDLSGSRIGALRPRSAEWPTPWPLLCAPAPL